MSPPLPLLRLAVLTAVVIAAYAFVATFLILKLINVFGPIRVPDSEQIKGLDDSVRRVGLRLGLEGRKARRRGAATGLQGRSPPASGCVHVCSRGGPKRAPSFFPASCVCSGFPGACVRRCLRVAWSP